MKYGMLFYKTEIHENLFTYNKYSPRMLFEERDCKQFCTEQSCTDNLVQKCVNRAIY